MYLIRVCVVLDIINVYVSVTNTETTMYCARGLYFYASPTKVTCESGVHGSTVHITSRHLNCTFHLCEVDIYGTKCKFVIIVQYAVLLLIIIGYSFNACIHIDDV